MSHQPRRILVTGSSGLVGTNLSLHLIERGDHVIGVDVRPNPWTSRIPTLMRDLLIPNALDLGFPQLDTVDLVVHLAAHPTTHRAELRPDRPTDDISIRHAVLEFCRRRRLPHLFAGARELCGLRSAHDPGADGDPQSFYPGLHANPGVMAEALIRAYTLCFGLPSVIFRVSNVYGRFDTDVERIERVVPVFIRSISANRPVRVYGPDQAVDFLWIDDCVEGLVRGIDLLLSGDRGRYVMNLGSGVAHTLSALAQVVGSAVDKEPSIEFVRNGGGDVYHFDARLDQAVQILGWEPRTSLDQGIRRAIDWSVSDTSS